MVGFMVAVGQKPMNLPSLPGIRSGKPTSLKVTSHDDLPNLKWALDWNDTANTWDSTARHTYSYAANGNLVEEIIQNFVGPGFVNAQRLQYAWNSQGLMQTEWSYRWNGMAWEYDYRTNWTYDAQQNPSSNLTELWDGSAWGNLAGYRWTNTYVFTNRLAASEFENWNPATMGWDLYLRYESHWPSVQGWDTLATYTYSLGTWVPSERAVDYVWLDFDQDLELSGRWQQYDGQNWADRSRFVCTYTSQNQDSDFITEAWNGTNWQNEYRYINDDDSLGHRRSFHNYQWLGTWDLTGSSEFDYIYDNQGHTMEIVTRPWNGISYNNAIKEVFGSFFTGLGESQTLACNVTAYPNPCTDLLHFRMELPTPGPVQIALYDVQGRPRLQTVAAAQTDMAIEVPISETLENGTYLYRLSTKSGRAEGKVFVSH